MAQRQPLPLHMMPQASDQVPGSEVDKGRHLITFATCAFGRPSPKLIRRRSARRVLGRDNSCTACLRSHIRNDCAPSSTTSGIPTTDSSILSLPGVDPVQIREHF